jgi:toxin ParE1/3/4
LNVKFTPQARADLIGIRAWIAQDDDRAADRVLSRIRQTAMLLGQFPMMGRPGQVEDTREFTVTGLPYVLVYQLVTPTDLDILTVLHTRRKYPPEI